MLISLPISEDRRRALFSRLDAPGWRLSPIDACYPPNPDSLTTEEWDLYGRMSERLRNGQRGCFLSHRRAWTDALDSAADLTVVLEDDAIPLYRRPPPLPSLPKDLDILYLHHFAQYLPTGGELLSRFVRLPIDAVASRFRCYPIDDVLSSHCGLLHRAAMPACAYAITPAGAEKLLAIFDEVGNFFQWDSIMLRHAIGPRVFEKLSAYVGVDGSAFYQGQRPGNASQRISSISLNAYAIYPPWFLHDYDTPSVKFNVAPI